MSPDTWLKIAQAVGAVGGITMFGAAFKWVFDQLTGRNERKTRRIRSALEAMGDAGEWADAYWELRTWCRRSHGFDGSMPEPPET